jgi:hypothetical protein
LWLNKRLNSVQLESFLSQKSHCFELHFDLFREKSAGRGAGMGVGMSAGMSAGRGVGGRFIRGILVEMVL